MNRHSSGQNKHASGQKMKTVNVHASEHSSGIVMQAVTFLLKIKPRPLLGFCDNGHTHLNR